MSKDVWFRFNIGIMGIDGQGHLNEICIYICILFRKQALPTVLSVHISRQQES